MSFDPTIAAIRFGEGLAPSVAAPSSVSQILDLLAGPDNAATSFPVDTFTQLRPQMHDLNQKQKAYRKARGSSNETALFEQLRSTRRAYQRRLSASYKSLFARSLVTPDGFRERLTRFWASHFTIAGRNNLTKYALSGYVEEAIRPHVTGKFEDLLIAAITHPMMLDYLDQASSVGPNSIVGRRRNLGLNENLAREVIELHTLGSTANYTQTDIRQLAELLTGLSFDLETGPLFRHRIVEPGSETVLGVEFGGNPGTLEDVHDVLRYLAQRPETGRFLATKIASHFLSDDPDPAVIAAMADEYAATGGDLMAVYAVLLDHPASWSSFGEKIKQPIDFVLSSFRALAVPPKTVLNANRRTLRMLLLGPLSTMGQPLFSPPGPDGWPENGEAWITPHGLAARIQWAMSAPSAIFRGLPDPRYFVETALADQADPAVIFAARNAEHRREGIGLVLASAAFQRR